MRCARSTLRGRDAGRETAAKVDAVAAGHASASTVLAAAIPLWLAATPLITLAWMLHRNRRDRLRGGAAEQHVANAIGPLQAVQIHRARKRARQEGPLTPEGVLLGHDPQGRPIRIPELITHATIVGGSNSGKTNTAKVLLEAQVASGGGFVVLDGKGGRDLAQTAPSCEQPLVESREDAVSQPRDALDGGIVAVLNCRDRIVECDGVVVHALEVPSRDHRGIGRVFGRRRRLSGA